MGQRSGLLAIIVLSALAGLAGASIFAGAAFSEAYPRALRAAAVICRRRYPYSAGDPAATDRSHQWGQRVGH